MLLLLLAPIVCLSWQLPESIREIEARAPKFGEYLRRVAKEPTEVAAELGKHFPLAPVMEGSSPRSPRQGSLPIVVTHGMGDSCFNAGMESITKAAGDHAGVYAVCVPGGPNKIEDTLSAFFINMDKNVDNFAAQVRNDTNLSKGFDAFGLSQGNAILRGYIQRYNNPPVRNYLAIHGVDFGVMGFPNCNPAGIEKNFCDALVEVLGELAYAPISQEVLFQTNYFRDPLQLNTTAYLANSQIAQWNNENPSNVNATFKANFGLVKSWNMIKALKDTMVFPNEGEWWGQFVPGQFQKVQTMNQTALYIGDNFGLKTADSLHKIRFNFTTGEHLQFTVAQLDYWIDEYFN